MSPPKKATWNFKLNLFPFEKGKIISWESIYIGVLSCFLQRGAWMRSLFLNWSSSHALLSYFPTQKNIRWVCEGDTDDSVSFKSQVVMVVLPGRSCNILRCKCFRWDLKWQSTTVGHLQTCNRNIHIDIRCCLIMLLNIAPKKSRSKKRRVVSQPSFIVGVMFNFRCFVGDSFLTTHDQGLTFRWEKLLERREGVVDCSGTCDYPLLYGNHRSLDPGTYLLVAFDTVQALFSRPFVCHSSFRIWISSSNLVKQWNIHKLLMTYSHLFKWNSE